MHDAQSAQEQLERAGRTLLSMHIASPIPCNNMRVVWPEYEHSLADVVHRIILDRARVRPTKPSPRDISEMDETFLWLSHIPDNHHKLRRVVGLRSLVVMRGGWMVHLHSWRAVGDMMHTSHETARMMHRQGLGWIVCALSAEKRAA